MLEAAANRPRLIVVGAESSTRNEPLLAHLSRCCEVCLVGNAYSSWSSAYADTQRVCSYLTYGGLFAAVTDLMGEVPFCGVLSLDAEADEVVSRVTVKLGMPDTSGHGPEPDVDPAQPCVVAESRDGTLTTARGLAPGEPRLISTAADHSVTLSRSDSLVAYREGTSTPFLDGLSPIARSGLLNDLDLADLADVVSAAFDPASRAMMRWIEPAR